MSIPTHEEFLQTIKSDLENDKLILPSFPEVATKAREAANDENSTAQDLAAIINTDAALSARLLKVSNSPLFRARSEIDNIQIAITRMGNKVVKNLIMSICVEQMFSTQSKKLSEHFKNTWQHSIHVAAFSRVLAANSNGLDPEQAMLAGLFHNIGSLPILMAAENCPLLLADSAALEQMIEQLQPEVGKLIVEHWNFPDNLTEVVWEHNNLLRDPHPDADYSDVVLVANLQIPSGKSSHAVNWADIPAFKKLGLDHEIEVIEIEGVADQIEEVEEIFITA